MNNEENQNNLFQTNLVSMEPPVNNNQVPFNQPSIENRNQEVVPMQIPTEIIGSQTPYIGANQPNNSNSFMVSETQNGYTTSNTNEVVTTMENTMMPSVQPQPMPIPEVNTSFENRQVVQNNEQQQNGVTPPTASFTEMPFAGVNQQDIQEEKVTILPNTPISSEVENKASEVASNSNMQPVEKKVDENAGIKFLLILFVIFLVVILCLPLIGLN